MKVVEFLGLLCLVAVVVEGQVRCRNPGSFEIPVGPCCNQVCIFDCYIITCRNNGNNRNQNTIMKFYIFYLGPKLITYFGSDFDFGMRL